MKKIMFSNRDNSLKRLRSRYFRSHYKETRMIFGRFFCLLIIFLSVVSFPVSAHQNGIAPKVLMVLWRGMTDAEKGFQEYFREHDLPVEFTG